MPIKPENKARYPKDWKQIRERILLRASHKCEQCGVRNHALGYRDPDDGRFIECVSAGHATGYRVFKIVLTIAHLDHIPENCADDNLSALCQLHHLRMDAYEHAKNARATREARSGQKRLFP